MSIIFNIIESKSTVNVVNDFVRITVADGVSVDTVNSLIDDKLTKENIIGLKLADSPEFADELITPLATEATYTPAVWAYLVGLFTSVPKSVKAHIVKMWGNINDMATRVGILEDSYLLKYVVPVDTASINLTTDKYGNAFNFTEGDQIEIIIQVKLYATPNRINFRVNNNSNSIYKIGNSELNYIYTAGANYVYQYTSVIVNIINAEIQGTVLNHSKSEAGAFVTQYSTYHTEGLNTSAISELNLYKSTDANIPAGTVIIVKKR